MADEAAIGTTIEIAGMRIEILADTGDSWRCRNLTTGEALAMQKAVIDKAIRFGQATVLSPPSAHDQP